MAFNVQSFVRFIAGFVIGLFALSPLSGRADIGVQASDYGQRLFFLETSMPGKCLWKVHDLRTGKTRQVFETNECPVEIIWDLRTQIITFHTSAKLVAWAWNKPSAKASVVELPTKHALDLWLDDKSGYPRLADIVPPEKVELMGKDEALVYDGKKYSTAGLVPWGSNGLVLLYELQSGKWQRIAVAATKWGPVDAPGTAVLNEHRHVKQHTVSLKLLLDAGTCGKRNCTFETLETSPDIKRKLMKLVTNNPDKGEIPGYIAVDHTAGLLFQQRMGDTYHATLPAFLCSNRCAEVKKLERVEPFEGGGFSISIAGRLLLLSDEYSGRNGCVYSVDNANPILVLPPSQGAIWLPPGIF